MLGVGVGDRRRVQRPESLEDLGRSRERALHGELLVEQHPHEQREGIGRQHLVGRGVLGDVQRGLHDGHPTTAAWPSDLSPHVMTFGG